MIINEHTKISALIKANDKTIDTIASINKHFKKLKNPILRKVLARRVSIADAAKIGGVSVDVFFEKLKAIGFELEEQSGSSATEASQSESSLPKIFQAENILTLDVRPDLKAGEDPFKRIMTALKTLPEGHVLKIINEFEPIPLISLLKEKGYLSFVERPEAGVVHAFFLKDKNGTSDIALPDTPSAAGAEFREKVKSYGDKIKTIDVRHLSMPEPMVTILTELEQLPAGHALFVHHKKFPKFLIPELQNRSYELLKHEIDEHHLELIIFKQ